MYQAAATVAELRPAVFRALLDSLPLPAEIEHLPQLRAVLGSGVANHYKDPTAWRA